VADVLSRLWSTTKIVTGRRQTALIPSLVLGRRVDRVPLQGCVGPDWHPRCGHGLLYRIASGGTGARTSGALPRRRHEPDLPPAPRPNLQPSRLCLCGAGDGAEQGRRSQPGWPLEHSGKPRHDHRTRRMRLRLLVSLGPVARRFSDAAVVNGPMMQLDAHEIASYDPGGTSVSRGDD
jgi:hypothetical protein